MSESEEEVDFEQLMSEPPGGMNHGRRKTTNGRWVPLEATDFSYLPDQKQPVAATTEELSVKHYRQPKHGTPYGYVSGCRCAECRHSWADYQRERRRKKRGP